jgi:hypothetical protein
MMGAALASARSTKDATGGSEGAGGWRRVFLFFFSREEFFLNEIGLIKAP